MEARGQGKADAHTHIHCGCKQTWAKAQIGQAMGHAFCQDELLKSMVGQSTPILLLFGMWAFCPFLPFPLFTTKDHWMDTKACCDVACREWMEIVKSGVGLGGHSAHHAFGPPVQTMILTPSYLFFLYFPFQESDWYSIHVPTRTARAARGTEPVEWVHVSPQYCQAAQASDPQAVQHDLAQGFGRGAHGPLVNLFGPLDQGTICARGAFGKGGSQDDWLGKERWTGDSVVGWMTLFFSCC